jgi:hypothetical protein
LCLFEQWTCLILCLFIMLRLENLFLFEIWIFMNLSISLCLNVSTLVWRYRLYMFKSSWSIIFLSLFASWFEILDLIWVLMSNWSLRKMFESLYLIVLSAQYLKWMFNICSLFNIMFYHILSNFEFELVCHMYIVRPISIVFELLCLNIQCRMSIVICIFLQSTILIALYVRLSVLPFRSYLIYLSYFLLNSFCMCSNMCMYGLALSTYQPTSVSIINVSVIHTTLKYVYYTKWRYVDTYPPTYLPTYLTTDF